MPVLSFNLGACELCRKEGSAKDLTTFFLNICHCSVGCDLFLFSFLSWYSSYEELEYPSQ